LAAVYIYSLWSKNCMINATNYLVTVHLECEEVLAVADLIESCGHKRIQCI
jgi:hypothetical protein